MMTKLRRIFVLVVLALVSLVASERADASIATLTLTPSSLTTTHGSTAGSVASMRTLDESGLGRNPSKYVQFQAKTAGTTYAGHRTYTLPRSVSPSSIIAIQVQTNYLGLAKSAQTWTWQIYDWKHQAYVTVGDNYFAPNNAPLNNGPWTILSFNISGNNITNYVSPNRQIELQTVSTNSDGDADIDYEALIVTTTSIPPPAPRSFYVSTAGNDLNPGTITMPWRTICKAAKCSKAIINPPVGPGSTVYVRGGIYHEQVVVGVSGSAAGGYIQFQSYPGETAIVDGSGVAMPPSDSTPNGLFQLTGRNYVIIQGFEIRNWMTNSDRFFPAGIAITGTDSYIQILHNKVHGIVNNFCAANQTCCGNGSCNGGSHGVAAYGTEAPASINHLVIDGNELYGLVLGQSESMPMNGNVERWSITNNIVHDNNNIGIDAIGFEGTAPNVAYDHARDGYIGGNLVYNIDDRKNPAYFPTNRNGSNGIYVDGGTRIVIERNIIHHDNVGLELASEILRHVTSYVTARNNLIYLDSAPGVAIGGHDIPGTDPNNPDCCGSTDYCSVVNNTLFENDSTPNDGSGEFIINYFPKNVSGNIFENNLIVANSQGVLINNGFSNPVVQLNYNLYFAPNGDPTNNTWIWNNVTYSDYSTYQMNSGNDMRSPFDDPLFLTSPNLNLPSFSVRPTSRAVDAGANLGNSVVGVTDLAGFNRFLGGLIDIGAYQQ
jgi:hypothetical protein